MIIWMFLQLLLKFVFFVIMMGLTAQYITRCMIVKLGHEQVSDREQFVQSRNYLRGMI